MAEFPHFCYCAIKLSDAMQGLIFQQLKEFIRKKLGLGFWDDIRKQAGVETTLYASVQAYPDKELLSLIRVMAERLGLPTQPMLEEFGRFFVPHFIQSRSYLIDPKWGYLDLLEHGPEILRQVEKRSLPGSDPAFLESTRNSPDQLTMRYSSKRKLCAFIKGILHGLAKHYQVRVEIEEPRCVFRGHSECVFIIRVLEQQPEHTGPQ
jgi:predicted hydrocarbon binding protein